MHRHPASNAKRNYLLIDDFHSEIFTHTGVAQTATTRYVRDMIDWGFLERLRKEHGVARGRFAVQMTPFAFETFRNGFVTAGDVMLEAARDFGRISSQDKKAAVLQFRATR
jgi:hypothetical protein